ncbi:hypothetical protein KIN20_031560 [Parelaphostrongylus tenuis]|uniref:Mos1 transposase HTH domain-containing protein n=1 Tax=Parelaphostrongylus tenuis TaxID=148309 RepID=A0AAD5R5H2_PARTN|nr:hypothetical protein KIN20_031560 [Parelaphostrongylus tenuis]
MELVAAKSTVGRWFKEFKVSRFDLEDTHYGEPSVFDESDLQATSDVEAPSSTHGLAKV